MNIKFLVVTATCVAYGVWFALIGGKQVSTEHVEALYKDYASAFDRGDGKAVCALFSDRIHGKFTSTSRTMPVRESIDKKAVCSSVEDFYRTKKQLEAAAGAELYTNIEYTIKSISIAPDKKSASAQVLMEMRIGTERGPLLDMRSTQTDVIQRTWGKTQFVQSDGSVSFYK